MSKTDSKSTPGLQQQIMQATEQARVAGDSARHGLLHTLEMRVAEAVYATRDSERILQGDDLDLVRNLRSVLTIAPTATAEPKK